MLYESESAINSAIADIESGISLRKAAQRWGIPRSTLHRRVHGAVTRNEANKHNQRLSKQQESSLVQWIISQGDLGFAPTHQQVREFAARIVKAGGDDQPLGKAWMEGFLRRNPEVRTLRGKPIDSCRLNGATTKIIKEFFALLKIPEIENIPPDNRYNMDETGLLEGRGSNGLVLGAAYKKVIMKKQPGSRCWTSILECISATGRVLTPLVIFKGLSVQHQWFPTELDFLADWAFEASERGWTSDSIAVKWLQEIFIPQTKPKKPGKRLLVVDGHGSHCTDDFLYECYRNNIYLLFLPPHTSHVLQPLDISIFSPVKTYYRQALANFLDLDDSTPYNKMIFLRCYHQARKLGLTERNARAGWLGSGLWPVNLAKPMLNPYLILEEEGQSSRPSQAIAPRTPLPTARKRKEPDSVIFNTPRRSQQVRTVVDSIGVADPTARLLFRKIGSHLDHQNTKLAAAEAKIRNLQHQLDGLRPKKKKKVEENPNKRFIRIEEIVNTRKRLKQQLQLQTASKTAAAMEFEDLCHSWQLE
jgi:hypothetical protein